MLLEIQETLPSLRHSVPQMIFNLALIALRARIPRLNLLVREYQTVERARGSNHGGSSIEEV